jgi:hypothetical protein
VKKARRYLDDALMTSRAGTFWIQEGQALMALAEFFLPAGEFESAQGHAEHALATLSKAGHRSGQARSYLVLSRVSAEKGHTDKADELRQLGISMFTDMCMPVPDELA